MKNLRRDSSMKHKSVDSTQKSCINTGVIYAEISILINSCSLHMHHDS